MATYTCQVVPTSVWFPVDPKVVELPAAPSVVVNPAPEPANTAPGTYTEADFAFDTENYGYVKGDECYTVDYGFVSAAVSATNSYGNVLTVWDTLPTSNAAIPAEEVDVTTIYPPYREAVVQIFTVFAVVEVISIQKVTVELNQILPVKIFVAVTTIVNVTDIICVVYTACLAETIGNDVLLPVRTTMSVEVSPGVLRLGMEYGYI